jgi:hypothetical protein
MVIMERGLSTENEAHLSNELKTHGLLRAVHEKIRLIAITDISNVVRKDRSTDAPIVPVEQTVTRLINMFRILRRCGLEVLPPSELAAVLETCLRVNAIFDMIKTYDINVVTSLNTPGTVDQIASQTEEVAQSAYQTLGAIIAKTFHTGEYFNSQVEGAQESFAEIMSLSQEARFTLDDVQKLARREVGNKFGDSFHNDAIAHNKSFWRWLTAFLAFTGVTYLLIAQDKILHQTTRVSVANLLANEILQLATVAFPFYLMTFCAKNAASHKHNYIVNLHRRSALSTANIFADLAGSESLKNSILFQAATAAYESRPTGFEKTKS